MTRKQQTHQEWVNMGEDEDDCEELDEEEEEENDTAVLHGIFDNDSLTKPQEWENGITVHYYLETARRIVRQLNNWSFNRNLNKAHVKQIKDALVKQKSPHLMGTIQIVRDIGGKCKVINGQHRLQAVKEILELDVDHKFNLTIMCEVYNLPIQDMDDAEDETAMVDKLFKTANANLNFKAEDDHELFCKQVVQAMRKEVVFKEGLVNKTTGTVYKPRLLEKDLFEAFKEHLVRKYTVQETVKKIKDLNMKLGTKTNLEMFGRNKLTPKQVTQMTKAEKIGFYLNVATSKYPPEVWIKMI